MIIGLSLLVALIGLLMYVLISGEKGPSSAKWAEVGRILLFAGVLSFLLQVHTVIGTMGR